MDTDEQHTSPSLGTDQPTAAAVRAQAPAQKPAGSPVETAVKLAGLAGAVSAAMGMPAVFLNFKRLGIPTHYIDYQLVLSAGILPTVLLLTIALYFRAVLRQVRGSGEVSRLHAAPIILLAVPVLPVLLIGVVASGLLYAWALSWLVILPFRWWGLFDPTNRELLYIAVVIVGLGSVGYVLREHLLRLKPVRWFLTLHPIGLMYVSRTGAHRSSSQPDPPGPVDRTQQTRTPEQEAMQWLARLPTMWLGMPAMMVGLFFAIKGVLYLWEPPLARILPAGTIVWAGIGFGFVYGLMMSSIAWMQFFECDSRRMKNIGLAIAMGSLLLAGGFFVTLYSTKIYPVLSQVWGGGRPEPVIVWIDQEGLPPIEEMRRRLPEADVTPEGTVVRVEAKLALRAGKEMILLNGSGATAQGVALPMESLKMVAWGPEE